MMPLANSIYKTVVFFDAQEIALTLMELRNYLLVEDGLAFPPSLRDIQKAVDTELKNKLDSRDGWYFLAGRSDFARLRQQRYRESLRNFRKALKYLSLLRFFPYLRAVAISGSLALLNSSENSDIDLFVITRRNRIWLTRLLLSLYFQILGRRRHGYRIRGRFCLNHYAAEGLELQDDRNLYTAIEYTSLIPVLGQQNLEAFWRQNSWIKEYVLDPAFQNRNTFFSLKFNPLQRFFELFLDLTLGPLLNWLSGIYQKKRIKMQEHILVSDTELSFHPGSRGQKILAKFQQKLDLTVP